MGSSCFFRRLHLSFRSRVPTPVFQAVAIQVVAQARRQRRTAAAATPLPGCWCLQRLHPFALRAMSLNPMALVALGRNSGTNGSGGIARCGCNTGALIPTLPPSSSSAFGVNSLALSFVQKLSLLRLPGGKRLIVRAHHSACSANKQCGKQ